MRSKMACVVVSFCVATAIVALAKTTLKTLANFDGSNGLNPGLGFLVQGSSGDFYGTTIFGGANDSCTNGCGSVFKITPGGTLTTLYSFCVKVGCTDGESPLAGLVQATNGDFYGTTYEGGANDSCTQGGTNGCGTVFKITQGGTLTTLYSFCSQTKCADGANPHAELVQDSNGDFYGTTFYGGTSDNCPNGCGSVFQITPAGKLTTLHSFDGTDGQWPFGWLVQATNGNFYGTTTYGGANGYGTVFKMTLAGMLTTLHNFDSTDGGFPWPGLTQATNGILYGTTYGGGNSACELGCGTVFKITLAGKLTTLYNFCAQTNCTDGSAPYAGLVQATDGNFYGTTSTGGSSASCTGGCGTVFKLSAAGKLTTLHSFNSGDGANPYGGLLQATNGKFYGTAHGGGANGDGAVFSLSVGLSPFVVTLPAAAKAGGTVIVLGTDLTGATAVTFNNTAATFTVVSASEIKTTVPTGATTGTVEVTIPSGTLSSNVPFRVL